MTPRLVLLLLVASCGSETIGENVCGNGIVDPFEDCDAANDRCVGCSITCASDDECVAYDPGTTDGFVCGPDNLCHAPAGTFELGNQFSQQAIEFRVSDVDRDGVGDLLVQSQTSVTAVTGAADRATAGISSIQTPIAFGPAGFADVDGDGGLDSLLPTADGIAAFTSAFGTPAPYPFPSTIGPEMGVPRFVQPLAPTQMLFIGTDANQSGILMIAMDVAQQTPMPIGQSFICGGAAFSELEPTDVDVVTTSLGHQIYALTLHPATGPLKLCLVKVDFNGATYDITPLAFAPQNAPRGRAVLANLKGEQCPSLLVSEGGGTLMEYPGASPSPPCSFGSPAAVPGAPLGASPVGALPLIPPIPNTRPGAIVLSTGVYAIPAAGNVVELYHSDRELQKVRIADVDRDGDVDAIASGVGADDLDVLDRIQGGGFLKFRFDTAAPVTNFLIGDYDGNEIPDVAYLERSVENGVGVERLNIAFGTFDQLLPGVTVGAFSRVETLIPSQFLDSTDPFGVIDDLVVLGRANADDVNFVLSLLHGSPQRAMLAFFDPRPTVPPPPGSQFRGVVVGKFSDNTLANDVLAVEQIASTATTNFYLSRGTAGGAQEFQGLPGNTQDAAMCEIDDANGKLCVDRAIYTTWALEPNDRVVAVDEELVVGSFDPAKLTAIGGTQPPPLEITRWPGRIIGTGTPRQLRQVTFADGVARLLISLGARPDDDTRSTGAVDLCAFDPDPAIGPTCIDVGARIMELTGEPMLTCVDAAVGRVAAASRFSPPATTGADLLVVCHHAAPPGAPIPPPDTVYRVGVEGGEVTSATPLFLELLGDSVSIQIGDVSGDGIDDIVVLDRGSIVPQFRVFRQCTSRDAVCGALSAVEEEP